MNNNERRAVQTLSRLLTARLLTMSPAGSARGGSATTPARTANRFFTPEEDQAIINFATGPNAGSDARGVKWYRLPANSILRRRWSHGAKYLSKRAKTLSKHGRMVAHKNNRGRIVRYSKS
jgi:hypothetical protein